eukprot:TRINITY_DN12961_c0_g1_i1.p1 TRINITY_DN12961_c0_g1~~TRINITY_DN12961_c0_g1_i1.p1  ORF type:complete len:741 (+),score=158.49 TRINITY_DN12961_c0_g1_i1:22-2223(+)
MASSLQPSTDASKSLEPRTFSRLLMELEQCHRLELAASGSQEADPVVASSDRCEQMLSQILARLDSLNLVANVASPEPGQHDKMQSSEPVRMEEEEGDEEEKGTDEEYGGLTRDSTKRSTRGTLGNGQQKFPLRPIWVESIESTPTPEVLRRSSISRTNSFGSGDPSQDQDGSLDVEDRCMRLVTQPSSTRSLTVDVIGAALLLYEIIVLPLRTFDDLDSTFTIFMDWLSLIWWTVNIFASLTTGYFSQGLMVMDLRRILLHYLKTWFFVDVVTLGPDWTFVIASLFSPGSLEQQEQQNNRDSLRVLRWIRLMRMMRLLRLVKLKRLYEAAVDYFDSESATVLIGIVRMAFILIFVNHLLACSWWAIGSLDQNSASWIKAGDFESGPLSYQYFVAYHWALTQFTPSSMDVQPVNLEERIFTVSVIVLGLLVFSWIVGSITGSLTQLRHMSEQQSKDFWFLRRFLRKHTISRSLSARIVRFIEHVSMAQKRTTAMSQVKVLSLLSKQLMDELYCELHLPALIIHPLFERLNGESRITLQKLAQEAVSHKYLANGDTLFQEHEVATAMFFLAKGRIKYTRNKFGKAKSEFVDANEDWISEHTLWTPLWLHVGDAVARDNCEILAVSPVKFEQACSMARVVASIAGRYGEKFLDWMQRRLQVNDLTDVIQGDLEGDSIKACIPNSAFKYDLEEEPDEPDELDRQASPDSEPSEAPGCSQSLCTSLQQGDEIVSVSL